MRALREKFLEWFGDRGAIFLQWIEDAFAKVANLRFHELEADEIAFFLACAVIVALAILKLARKPAAQK
jgi:hypothetical protein